MLQKEKRSADHPVVEYALHVTCIDAGGSMSLKAVCKCTQGGKKIEGSDQLEPDILEFQRQCMTRALEEEVQVPSVYFLGELLRR
jgi:hypothetical protein